MENNFPQPNRVLVITAHPDDPEFGAAGTVALWARQGAEVTFVIVTDGSKGSPDPNMTRWVLAARPLPGLPLVRAVAATFAQPPFGSSHCEQ